MALQTEGVKTGSEGLAAPGADSVVESEPASAFASAASFNRSALLMYMSLFFGASLALAFFALALSIWLSFLRRFMPVYPVCRCWTVKRQAVNQIAGQSATRVWHYCPERA